MTEPGAVLSPAELHELATTILEQAGAGAENARIVADHLVEANLCGVDTHGVCHLPGYVADVRAGRLDPAAKPAVLRSTPTTALVSGGWTFGQVGALFAAERASELAALGGIALVGLVETHHIGRLGHFVELLAGRGQIGLIWSGGYGERDPHAAPYGGRERLLGTNPIAGGFPGGEEAPVTFDFATTAVAGMKVHDARRRGEALPAGSVVDADGVPASDPEAFFAGGAHVPFGGHKGYAIAMSAEWLGSVLTGSETYGEGRDLNPILGRQGVTFVVLQADAFIPMAQFAARSAELIRRTHATAPARGVERVLVPGEPEHLTRERRLAEGIPIEADVWADLMKLREEMSVR